MGILAHGVLFRIPGRDVIRYIHYSRSPALTNWMHWQVPATISKLLWLTLSSICIHPNGWDHYLLLTKGRDSANCMWIMHVDTRIVCCDTYSFLYPRKLCFWWVYCFHTVRPSVCASVRNVFFFFFNILKSHCWSFIKPYKHDHICKTNTLDKKVRARGQFYWSYFPL